MEKEINKRTESGDLADSFLGSQSSRVTPLGTILGGSNFNRAYRILPLAPTLALSMACNQVSSSGSYFLTPGLVVHIEVSPRVA